MRSSIITVKCNRLYTILFGYLLIGLHDISRMHHVRTAIISLAYFFTPRASHDHILYTGYRGLLLFVQVQFIT